MSTMITLPKLGDAAQAIIQRFFKAAGEAIDVGEPLCLVLTPGFEWEVPATTAGTLAEPIAAPGSSVRVGEPLAAIEGGSNLADEARPGANGRVPRVTPLARKIATLHDVELASVVGTGPGQRVMRHDVVALVEPTIFARPNHVKTASHEGNAVSIGSRGEHMAGPAETRKVNERPAQSRVIAGVERAQLAPPAVVAIEVDMQAIDQYVARHRARLARRHIVLDHVACVASAVVTALGQHRLLNSAWSDDGVILRGRIHLDVVRGVSSEGHRLIPDAAQLSVQGLARSLSSGTESTAPRPRSSFTLTAHDGSRWSEIAVPPGQSACLSIGAIVRRPCVVEDGSVERVAIRPLSWLTLSYDARVVDEARAHAFLLAVRRQVEQFSGI